MERHAERCRLVDARRNDATTVPEAALVDVLALEANIRMEVFAGEFGLMAVWA